MNRLLLLLTLLFGGMTPPPKLAQTPPNVVIILADDLGYGDLGCFGNKVIQTPHLDQMAAQGLRLSSCYSAASVCSPSRAGLLTGKIPTRLGIYDWIPENSPTYLHQDIPTIASVLQSAQYQTGHFGKWHLNGYFNQPQHPQPNQHGFDHYFGTQNNAAPSHQNPTNFVQNGQNVGLLAGYSCQIVADKAIEWLKKRDKNRPFYQHICFHEPHEPVASPEELIKQYAGQSPRERAEYYANITNLDTAVGRILAALTAEGILDNTIVIFTSDNGPETLMRYNGAAHSYGTAAPLRGQKLWLYEGGMRVPGIVYWQGHIKPRSSHQPISSLDFLPTLAALAKVPVPKTTLDGTDVSAFWLHDKPIRRNKPLFWFYYNSLDRPKAALREGPWKLVGYPDTKIQWISAANLSSHKSQLIQMPLEHFELYHIATDSSETQNLALSEVTITKKMARKMLKMKAEVLK